jgi:hypothetical protein
MTEGEWHTTHLPLPMLRRYPAAWDERKVRLFWCACLRRAWPTLVEDRTRELVELVERNPLDAGGELTAELVAFRKAAQLDFPGRGFERHPDYWALRVFLFRPPDPLVVLLTEIADRAGAAAVRRSRHEPATAPWWAPPPPPGSPERARQCRLIREVFGNPFRPARPDPAWLTSDVLLLARGIAADRAFDRMPILADALQDAGCYDAGVLDHCRGAGDHVRGCWVIEALLGK